MRETVSHVSHFSRRALLTAEERARLERLHAAGIAARIVSRKGRLVVVDTSRSGRPRGAAEDRVYVALAGALRRVLRARRDATREHVVAAIERLVRDAVRAALVVATQDGGASCP